MITTHHLQCNPQIALLILLNPSLTCIHNKFKLWFIPVYSHISAPLSAGLKKQIEINRAHSIHRTFFDLAIFLEST